MRSKRLSLSDILPLTALAIVAAVLTGFSQTFLLSSVPLQWWPYAWIAFPVTFVLLVLIGKAPRPGWFLSILAILLVVPLGIATTIDSTIVSNDLPADFRRTATVATVGALVLLVLANQARGYLSVSGLPRLSDVWDALQGWLWLLWALPTGVVGGFRFIDYIQQHGGASWTVPDSGWVLVDLLFYVGLVPIVATVCASWTSGLIRSGFFAGVLSAMVAWLIAVAYFNTWITMHGFMTEDILFSPVIGLMFGGPAGLVGGLLGVGLRQL